MNGVKTEYKNFLVIKREYISLCSVSMFSSDENNFWIVESPTCNCQVSSIADADAIIHKNNFEEIIYELYNEGFLSKQLLFDVHSSLSSKIIDIFKGNVVFNQPYISTNMSKMEMILIRFEEPEDEYENEDEYEYEGDY